MVDSQPHCECNTPAQRKKVVTPENAFLPNPHAGREFWGCANEKMNGAACGFFEWTDPREDDELTRQNCYCGIPAEVFEAQEGPNVGRKFRSCFQCDFHQWITPLDHDLPYFPYCPCGVPAVLRMVSSKYSDYYGCTFWGCMMWNRREGTKSPCDLFMLERLTSRSFNPDEHY